MKKEETKRKTSEEQFRIPNSEFRISNAERRTPSAFGLYFHVPFCAAKCPYCDFYSGRDLSLIPAYVGAVKDELATLRRVSPFVTEDVRERETASVYFGGGTPGLLPPETLDELLRCVRAHFNVDPNAEITVEVNPTLKNREAFFASVAAAGVNRISVGMQSAVEAELKALGRRGSPYDVAETVRAARAAGIGDISLDIMLGIPGQTPETLRTSLDHALSLLPTHLSIYILKLEEGTPLYARRNRLDLPDEDAAADLYLFACRYLAEKGMRHYEISNFCFGGRVGRHNLNYWRCGEYLGIGPAAHSYVDGKRFFFPRDLDAFLAGEKAVFDAPGGDSEEVFMLALRTDTGVDLPAFTSRFGLTPGRGFYETAAAFEKNGLLVNGGGTLRLTDKGFLVSNSIIAALLAAL